jgi:two-component system cell cycle sensor histidine kinase PleC
MKDGVLGPLGHAKYAEYSRDIHESGHRLLRLVDGILTMSEIEKGETSLRLGPVDPTAIARECLIDLGEFARDRNVSLIGRLILVPDVYADATALRQIFIHLITNALKRAAPGGRVEVGCESGAEDVHFTLRNLGPISSEIDLKRATLSAGSGHTNAGLGLVIAKSLIQLQGGELTVTNETDGSVTVGFTLPRQSAISRRERAA